MRQAIAAVLMLGALVGCTATPEPDHSKSYATVDELRADFESAGGKCGEWDQTNAVTLAAQSGDCSRSTVLSIYSSEGDRDEVVSNLKGIVDELGGEVHLLVGPNWIINTTDPESYVEALGGVVVAK